MRRPANGQAFVILPILHSRRGIRDILASDSHDPGGVLDILDSLAKRRFAMSVTRSGRTPSPGGGGWARPWLRICTEYAQQDVVGHTGRSADATGQHCLGRHYAAQVDLSRAGCSLLAHHTRGAWSLLRRRRALTIQYLLYRTAYCHADTADAPAAAAAAAAAFRARLSSGAPDVPSCPAPAIAR
ncbi:uncharacterized protein BP5553_03483 [Venustampulla echinocandica]|uniref:Uncharacterized protein n=1 Tax=Venustampulla echinocandica TaxID=2656787 RepID=A0A370TUD1_9HELO|nr:uncharacterized protein BP5553_03483 [Venustampulla echinocandica]RDL39143.1 hypothetical protein BP5553_03483 [Venustampulla echinocandica]